MSRYKIIGNINNKSYIELNIDLTRWLIGFGWYVSFIGYFHINIGPLVILFCWRK